jgi:hypothetical protein
MGCGLPSWNSLVNSVHESSGEARNPELDTNAASEWLLLNAFGGDRERFATAVGAALYQGLDEEAVLRHDLLRSVASVLMVGARRGLTTAITYNFDDLLETLLARHGLYAYPAIEQPCWYEQEDVSVLHPHGFSSRKTDFSSSKCLTFTGSDFDAQTGRANDPWRKKLIDLFERNTALFIGLSGEDPNLRSQLDEVKATHVAMQQKHLYWGVRICIKSDSRIGMWQSKGVWCWELDCYDDIPKVLMQICGRAASMLQKRASGRASTARG